VGTTVDTPAAAWLLTDDEVRAGVEAAAPQPLGGFPGRPEWVGHLISWLAGPENRFVTGQVIFADGGAEAALLGDRQWRG
jgi:NAD(P)-dependent dehydrogenase (short-subunit alcohol dehydrogenase family)